MNLTNIITAICSLLLMMLEEQSLWQSY